MSLSVTADVYCYRRCFYLTTSEMCRHQRQFSDVFIVLQSVYCARELRWESLNLCSVQMEPLAFIVLGF